MVQVGKSGGCIAFDNCGAAASRETQSGSHETGGCRATVNPNGGNVWQQVSGDET